MRKKEKTLKTFRYFQPTEVVFGDGRVKEVGEIVARYGKRCLLVTVDPKKFSALKPTFEKVMASLRGAGVMFFHFSEVVPNPTTTCIDLGIEFAQKAVVDVVLAVGGGSSIDVAKAIAVGVTHSSPIWDCRFCGDRPIIAEEVLPIIAVTTTSGTGSQVTQVSVLTNPAERDKSAIFDEAIYPKVAIVDPELMLTVPKEVTAATGFDVIAHALEAILHKDTSPYIKLTGWEAIRLVFQALPVIVNHPDELDEGQMLYARSSMAFADTLAGSCIANAGVTLPHGMAMAISGMFPKIAHGQALALVYPACMRFTWKAAPAQFARLGRILGSGPKMEVELLAAEEACELMDKFLKSIGLWSSLKEAGVPENELDALAKQCLVLPDYENDPRVATEDEMRALVQECYQR
jgi:alcohol dehydrogenase